MLVGQKMKRRKEEKKKKKIWFLYFFFFDFMISGDHHLSSLYQLHLEKKKNSLYGGVKNRIFLVKIKIFGPSKLT